MSQQTASESSAGTLPKPSRWATLPLELRALEEPSDLAGTLQQLLRLLQKGEPEHSAGVFLFDEETQTIHGQVTDLFDRDLSVGHGALPEALRQDAPYVIADLTERRRTDLPSERIRSQIVVPFRLTVVRGALILRSHAPHAYTTADGEALSQLAFAGSARIESALLRQKMLRVGADEVERDMMMAQEIMARLIPRRPPKIAGFELATVYVPAKVVGGDLLDFVNLGDDHVGLLVADAAGKGVPAALMMTGFRALFRGLIKNDFTIRSVFRKANNQLVDSTAPHQFVSAFYAGLDITTKRLIYVNGGHVPPLLFRLGQPMRRLEVGGPVLGIIPAATFHEDSVVLQPRDILVCFSDGLSEAANAAGEMFDENHIRRVVEANSDESADVICRTLQQEASDFVDGAARDDLTLCVLRFP
jgi:sigma-B regulation protein RsbU (phosphoserine phosphatase)